MIKAYASYFASYLLKNLKSRDKVNKIILFGSVAKNQSTKESDIDIFIEVNKKTKSLEKEIENLTKRFYGTREALVFSIKKSCKINVIVGKLEEWLDLKKSIESTGIILYSPYISSSKKGKKYAIISWDKIKKNRGAFLNKLYGFKIKDKRYPGLIIQLGGKKLGKSSIMIPIEHNEKIAELLKKYQVRAKMIEVCY